MSQTIAFPQFLTDLPKQGCYRRRLIGALLGLAIAALALAIVASTVEVVEAAFSDQRAAADAIIEFHAPELPRELQWHPKPVAVDHMYRRVDTPRLDWIYAGGRR
jgi:hypothetical protein